MRTLSSLRRCSSLVRWTIFARRRSSYVTLFLISLCILLYVVWDGIAFVLFGRLVPLTENAAQLWTCPTCYGTDFCDRIGEVHLEPRVEYYFTLDVDSRGVTIGHVIVPTGEENVKDEDKIIVKALGSVAELRKLDEEICSVANKHSAGACGDSSLGQAALSVATETLRLGENDGRDQQDYLSKLADLLRDTSRPNIGHCLRSPRISQRLTRLYDVNNDGLLAAEEAALLVTQLVANGEAVLFKAFPSNEGWPFPTFLGSCGRLVFEEHCGKPIRNYLTRPWPERVRLTMSLLDAVLTLTNNNQHFIFQLLDLTLDNFVLAENGMSVRMIDGEHVIVVDTVPTGGEEIKGPTPPPTGLKMAENTTCLDSELECQSFDTEIMCNGHSWDHNYMYTCKNILLGSFHRIHGMIVDWDGLLHSPPSDVASKLTHLLRSCVFSGEPHGRAKAFHDIFRLLQDMPSEIVQTSVSSAVL